MSLVVVQKFNFVDMLESIVRHRISHLLQVFPLFKLLKYLSNNSLGLCLPM